MLGENRGFSHMYLAIFKAIVWICLMEVFEISRGQKTFGSKSAPIKIYSVSKSKRTEEWHCYELIFGLLRSQKGSLGPQDWAQITFWYEINSNGHKNVSGRWPAKR